MSRIRTLAPRLPLNPNNQFGYDMLSTIRGTTKQNLKCLMLTSPGERVMDPEFGVGLKQYLFENFGPEIRVDLKTNIRQQIGTYLPFVKIKNIRILFGDDFDSPNYNKLFVSIEYFIQSTSKLDVLNLTVKND